MWKSLLQEWLNLKVASVNGPFKGFSEPNRQESSTEAEAGDRDTGTRKESAVAKDKKLSTADNATTVKLRQTLAKRREREIEEAIEKLAKLANSPGYCFCCAEELPIKEEILSLLREDLLSEEKATGIYCQQCWPAFRKAKVCGYKERGIDEDTFFIHHHQDIMWCKQKESDRRVCKEIKESLLL